MVKGRMAVSPSNAVQKEIVSRKGMKRNNLFKKKNPKDKKK